MLGVWESKRLAQYKYIRPHSLMAKTRPFQGRSDEFDSLCGRKIIVECSSVWLEYVIWDHGVASSNLVIPIKKI